MKNILRLPVRLPGLLDSIRFHLMPSGKVKLVFLCSVLLTSAMGQDPIRISTIVSYPISPYLSDYLGYENSVVVSLTNTSNQEQNIRLHAQLTSDRGFLASTREDYVPSQPLTIAPNSMYTLIGNSADLEFGTPPNINIDYGDFDLQDILLQNQLPEGSYTLCISAFDINSGEALSSPGPGNGCVTFTITHLQPPQLITPACNDLHKVNVAEPQYISFSWTPVINSIGVSTVVYDLYVIPFSENISPSDKLSAMVEGQLMDGIKIADIQISNYVFTDADLHLEPGQYDWAVVAKDISGQYPISNGGLSEICHFTYAENVPFNLDQVWTTTSNAIDVGGFCSCKLSLPQGLNAIDCGGVQTGDHVMVNYFDMVVTSVTCNNGKFSGTGEIPLPFLDSKLVRVKVSFESITIKLDGEMKRLTDGAVHGQLTPDALNILPPFSPNGMNFNPAQWDSHAFEKFFDDNIGQLATNIENADPYVALGFPIGLNQSVYNIAITGLHMGPRGSTFDALAVIPIPDGNARLAVGARDICIDQNDFCGELELYLLEDMHLPSIGFTLMGNGTPQETHITFDQEGFKEMRIAAGYTFPAGSLLHATTHQPAQVIMTATTSKGWSDWIATVIFDPFYIAGFPDFMFSMTAGQNPMIYDHSSTKNPDNLPSPFRSSDPNETPIRTDLMTWQGFYIPHIQIALPQAIQQANGQRMTIDATNLIFDEGISGKVMVSNILTIDNGSLDGWYYSIDEIFCEFWKNTFKQSGMKGKLVLPLSREHTIPENHLEYTCTLSKPVGQDLQFNFIIRPKKNIAWNVLWAEANLDIGTRIQVLKDGAGWKVEAALFGNFAIVPDIKEYVSIRLADIKFKDFRVMSNSPYFDPGQSEANLFSLASPQHSLFGFDIAINPNAGASLKPYVKGNEIGIDLNAYLRLITADFAPKAEVNFKIYGTAKTGIGGRPEWNGVGASLEKLELKAGAKIGPVGVKGKLQYFKSGSDYGLSGDLLIEVESVVTAQAKGLFASRTPANGQRFNYFFLDLMAEFSSPGVPIGPSLMLYGFGGGVYYNMTIDTNSLTADAIKGKNTIDLSDPMTSLSGITYTPQYGGFGIKAGVLLGLPTKTVFDADAWLIAEFNHLTGSVKSIVFNGHARMISPGSGSLSERSADAMGLGDLFMRLNFEEPSFLLAARMKIGVPNNSTKTVVGAEAYLGFYTGPEGWYVHIGTPWRDGNLNGGNPIAVDVLKIFQFKAYFQCGSGSGKDKDGALVNAIGPIPPIPNSIMEILRRSESGDASRINSKDQALNNGLKAPVIPEGSGGFMFGANWSLKLDETFIIFYINAEATAGFNLAFLKLPKGTKCGDQDMGVNGFYATGDAYIGAMIDIGLDLNLFFYDGRISIAEAGMAAYAKFGMPVNTYIVGQVGGYFSVLGGLIEGSFSMRFQAGDKFCPQIKDETIDLITSVEPSAEFDKEDRTKPVRIDEPLAITTRPAVAFNFKLDSYFLIVERYFDEEGNRHNIYRYYNLQDKDIEISLNGGVTSSKGDLDQIDKTHFVMAQDRMSYAMKNDYLLVKKRPHTFSIRGKVQIKRFDNINALSGYHSGYTEAGNSFSGRWEYVKKDNKVYVDSRTVSFMTNCGLEYITEDMVVSTSPHHRTTQVPRVNRHQLMEENEFGTDYFIYLNKPLNEKTMCIPEELEGNYVTKFRVTSFDRNASSAADVVDTDYFEAEMLDNGATYRVKSHEAMPPKNYMVVQMLIGPKVQPTPSTGNFSQWQSKSRIISNDSIMKVNQQVLVASALNLNASNYEFFKWYFTTGDYMTYHTKVKDLKIEIDTFSWIGERMINGAPYRCKGKEFRYTFSGPEAFSIKDLHPVIRHTIFEEGPYSVYPPNMDKEYLAYAFDDRTAGYIDTFLGAFVSIDPNKPLSITKSGVSRREIMVRGFRQMALKNFIKNLRTDLITMNYDPIMTRLPDAFTPNIQMLVIRNPKPRFQIFRKVTMDECGKKAKQFPAALAEKYFVDVFAPEKIPGGIQAGGGVFNNWQEGVGLIQDISMFQRGLEQLGEVQVMPKIIKNFVNK